MFNTYAFCLAVTVSYRTFRYDCQCSIYQALRYAIKYARQGLVIDGIAAEEN